MRISDWSSDVCSSDLGLMYTYLIKRLLMVIPTLLGAAILVFFLMRMIPGDVCQLKPAGSGAFFDQRSLDICRLELGLDDRKSVVSGKSVSVRVDLGGRRILKKQNQTTYTMARV